MTVDQSLPLSRHQAIVDLVVARVRSTIREQPQTKNPALVMVGRGNRDPCAEADMRILSALVDHRVDVAATHTAFYAMAKPRFTDVLSKVAASGKHDCIVVHPHLLFEGRLHEAIIAETKQVASEYPAIAFPISPYLGPTEEVAQALADRIAQAGSK